MIGERITARRRYVAAAILMLLIAGALFGLAVAVANFHWAIASLLPLAMAVAFWWFGSNDFELTIEENGLRLETDDTFIEYRDIQALSIAGRPHHSTSSKLKRGDIQIVHDEGSLTVPQHVDINVIDLYRFLLEKTPEGGVARISNALTDHARGEVEMFGTDHVFMYRARGTLGPKSGNRGVAAVGVALIFAAVMWVLIPLTVFLTESMHDLHIEGIYRWYGGAAGAFILGILVLLASRVEGPVNRRIKNWQQSCLVISPSGIALLQGDLKGVMRWEELLEVKPVHGPFGQDAVGRGVQLKVAGAQFTIEDIYNRPLGKIEDLIRRYWRPT